MRRKQFKESQHTGAIVLIFGMLSPNGTQNPKLDVVQQE
jgi:hypothetical protein